MKFEKISQEDREKLERRLYKTIVEEFRREKIKDGYYKYIVSLQEFKFITDITDNELKESISIAVDTMEELKKINNNDGMNKKKLKEIQDKEHRGEPFETLNIWNAIVTEQLKEFMKAMQQKGPKVIIATLGKNGSIGYDGNSWYRFGIIECKVVDTMGAGDSFIAGFLYGILNGLNVQDSMEAGAQNSAVTIGYQGAW